MAFPILPLVAVAALVAIVVTRKKTPETGEGAGAQAGEGGTPAGGDGNETGEGEGAQAGEGARQGLAGDAGMEGALLAILGGVGAPKAPEAPKPIEWYTSSPDGLVASPYGKRASLENLSDYRIRTSDASYYGDTAVEYRAGHSSRATAQDYLRLDDIVKKQQAAGFQVLIDRSAVDDFAAFKKPNYLTVYVSKDPVSMRDDPWERANIVLLG